MLLSWLTCVSVMCVAAFADNECFTGNTQVVIQESDTPVTMRGLKTGQHVQCVDSGDDFTTPTRVRWCEVVNWVRGHVICT
jgi:hypothetical protein